MTDYNNLTSTRTRLASRVVSYCCVLFGLAILLVNDNITQASSFADDVDVRHQYNHARDQDYYYTRTRKHPNHLRISEHFKNNYVDEIKFESTINGTKWEYYKAKQVPNFDELVFETIDKIFRHRLSPFYIHHYDNDDDKRRSFDRQRVSSERCARDLLYLVDKLHGVSSTDEQEQDYHAPELSAFFDSYAKPESGLLMGNTYWVGAYDQCIKRQIFDLIGETGPSSISASSSGPANKHQVVSFSGRYCVASLKSPQWDKLIEQRKRVSRNYFKTERQFVDYARLFRLQVGLCLPDSCSTNSIEHHKDEIRLLVNHALGGSKQRFAQYNLIDLYCLPDESSPLRQWSGSALGFVALVTVWIVLVLLATLADVCEFVSPASEVATMTTTTTNRSKKSNPSTVAKLIGWMSLRANYVKLMHVTNEETTATMKKTTTSVTMTNATTTMEINAPQQTNEQSNSDRQSARQDNGRTRNQASHAGAAAAAAAVSNKDNHEQTEAPTVRLTQQHARVNLKFLNAFKVMIMFWIVNGHIMLLMIQTAKNILDSDALLNGLMHFLIGATFGVDLFFTITGFLTAYLLFNSGHAYRMRPSSWLYLSFHRYWRLAPMYLLAFWFSRSAVQLLGSGPLWDYGTSALTYRGLCNQESWWYPLTLTSNLHGLFEECMITSWYISCDMQFWLVSPIFLHLLAHRPSIGWIVSIATMLASSRLRYLSILGEKMARHDELLQPRADIFMRVSHDIPALYTHPHYRISAYIVGLLAGHYVYMIKSGQWASNLIPKSSSSSNNNNNCAGDTHAQATEEISEQNLSKQHHLFTTPSERLAARRKNLLAYTGVSMFLVMAFISYLLSNYFPSSWLIYAREISAYGYAIDHLVMSLGASLVIVTMCFGHWPRFTALLSHPNWTRLSKINYALLLIQCEAIYYQIFRVEQVPVAGTRELINILFNLLVTLYPLAFLITLFFEFPLANVEKLLLGNGGRNSSEKNQPDKCSVAEEKKCQ